MESLVSKFYKKLDSTKTDFYVHIPVKVSHSDVLTFTEVVDTVKIIQDAFNQITHLFIIFTTFFNLLIF